MTTQEALREREGFYEKLWKDFVSLQRGDAVGVVEKVERYYREQEARQALSQNGEPADRDGIIEEMAELLDRCAKVYRSVIPKMNPYAIIRAEECEQQASNLRAMKETK